MIPQAPQPNLEPVINVTGIQAKRVTVTSPQPGVVAYQWECEAGVMVFLVTSADALKISDMGRVAASGLQLPG